MKNRTARLERMFAHLYDKFLSVPAEKQKLFIGVLDEQIEQFRNDADIQEIFIELKNIFQSEIQEN